MRKMRRKKDIKNQRKIAKDYLIENDNTGEINFLHGYMLALDWMVENEI